MWCKTYLILFKLTPCKFILSYVFFSVFNLTNGIDVKETEERIAAYKRENQDVIKKNKSKLVFYDYWQLLHCGSLGGIYIGEQLLLDLQAKASVVLVVFFNMVFFNYY